MSFGRLSVLAAGAMLLGLSGCSGNRQGNEEDVNSIDVIVPEGASAVDAARGVTSEGDVVSVGGVGVDPNAGATPMKDREAVLGILNKRNGATQDVNLKPGQATRIGDVVVRLRACERTAPWEAEQYTGAFVQVDVRQPDAKWWRVFSGWLFKERPGLNVVQHPIYDVWVKSCAMTFPDKGPGTVEATAPGAAGGNRSSAEKSPATEGAPTESPAEEAPSAAPSNAT